MTFSSDISPVFYNHCLFFWARSFLDYQHLISATSNVIIFKFDIMITSSERQRLQVRHIYQIMWPLLLTLLLLTVHSFCVKCVSFPDWISTYLVRSRSTLWLVLCLYSKYVAAMSPLSWHILSADLPSYLHLPSLPHRYLIIFSFQLVELWPFKFLPTMLVICLSSQNTCT